MRVAHVLRKYNPAQWGGTETAVKLLLDGLKDQGVGGTVYAPKLESSLVADPIRDAGHEVKRYKAFVPVINLSPEQKAQLISVGGNLMSFDLFGRLLTERRLSVVHTHALNRIGGIARAVASLRKLPLVVTIHGGVLDLPESVQKTLAAPLEGGFEWGKAFGALLRSRDVLKDADAIVTCNPREAELQQDKWKSKRVIVQPHGVSIAKYQKDCRGVALEAFPTLANRKIILIVGRVDPVKNQGWVLIQMPRLLEQHPDAVLVIAGACTDELYGKALRKEVRRLGIEQKVLFTGGLPPGDSRLIGLMQSSSMVVVPSLSETFGLIILEAWAARAPVLSTRTSGALSLVLEEENGLLFDLQNEDDFHLKASRVLTDRDYALRLAEHGNRLTVQEYDTAILSRRIKALYEELIKEKARA
jgi:glycosyltransferase involved in cell wall biosynthesis